MTQVELDWDSNAHARTSDPDTSKQAARKAGAFASTQAGRILTVLRQAKKGLTAHEIAVWSGLTQVQVARRLPDLQKAFLAEPMAELVIDGSRCWRAV